MSWSEMTFLQKLGRVLSENGVVFLQGARDTLIVALVGTLFGCLIGFVVGIVQTIPLSRRDNAAKRLVVRGIQFILGAYVEIFRGTPMIVQSMFIFYGWAMLTGKPMGVWPAALFIVSINTGAYMAETVRGGILSIDPGQTEGAKAIGMTHVQTMTAVILPQTLRSILPQIGNNLIINVKDTSVLFLIGFTELFYRAKAATGANYQYFATYTIIMVYYFVMTFVLSRLLRLLERRLAGSDSYDLATTDTLAHTSGSYSYPGKGSNFDERSKEYAQGVPAGKEEENHE